MAALGGGILHEPVEVLLELFPPVNFPVIRTVDRANVLSITQQDQWVGCGR
jgi:hypothetical protein